MELIYLLAFYLAALTFFYNLASSRKVDVARLGRVTEPLIRNIPNISDESHTRSAIYLYELGELSELTLRRNFPQAAAAMKLLENIVEHDKGAEKILEEVQNNFTSDLAKNLTPFVSISIVKAFLSSPTMASQMINVIAALGTGTLQVGHGVMAATSDDKNYAASPGMKDPARNPYLNWLAKGRVLENLEGGKALDMAADSDPRIPVEVREGEDIAGYAPLQDGNFLVETVNTEDSPPEVRYQIVKGPGYAGSLPAGFEFEYMKEGLYFDGDGKKVGYRYPGGMKSMLMRNLDRHELPNLHLCEQKDFEKEWARLYKQNRRAGQKVKTPILIVLPDGHIPSSVEVQQLGSVFFLNCSGANSFKSRAAIGSYVSSETPPIWMGEEYEFEKVELPEKITQLAHPDDEPCAEMWFINKESGERIKLPQLIFTHVDKEILFREAETSGFYVPWAEAFDQSLLNLAHAPQIHGQNYRFNGTFSRSKNHEKLRNGATLRQIRENYSGAMKILMDKKEFPTPQDRAGGRRKAPTRGMMAESRRYQHGDPVKAIDWMVSSRVGEIVVRISELESGPQKYGHILVAAESLADPDNMHSLVKVLQEATRGNEKYRGINKVVVASPLNGECGVLEFSRKRGALNFFVLKVSEQAGQLVEKNPIVYPTARRVFNHQLGKTPYSDPLVAGVTVEYFDDVQFADVPLNKAPISPKLKKGAYLIGFKRD